MYTNICLINSAICTSQSPLSYITTRSVFTHEERFQQVLRTIESVRQYMRDTYIVLSDATNVPKEWVRKLRESVEHYIDLSEDSRISELANHCPYKGVVDCEQTLAALLHINFNSDITSKHVFKISGRYTLTPSFEHKYFDNDFVVFKKVPDTCFFKESTEACYTFMYKVPYNKIDIFETALIETIDNALSSKKSIETILPFRFPETEIFYIKSLGIEGYIAPTGQLFVEFDWEVYLANNVQLGKDTVGCKSDVVTFWNTHRSKELTITSSNKKRCLMISHCYSAGTYVYYKYLASAIPDVLFLYYSKVQFLKDCDRTKIDFVHVSSIVTTDISISYLYEFLRDMNSRGIPIYFTLHDFQWIFPNDPNPAIDVLSQQSKKNKEFDDFIKCLQLSQLAFAPSQYVLDYYLYHANQNIIRDKVIVASNPDIKVEYDNEWYGRTNSTINIAHVGAFCPHKGSEHFAMLSKNLQQYRNIKLVYNAYGEFLVKKPHIKIHGRYDDDTIVDLLHNDNIHIIVASGPYGETWGYIMSKVISSGIPIVYYNIGSFKERLTSEKNNRSRFFLVNDMQESQNVLKQAIDFALNNQGTFNYTKVDSKIKLHEKYELLYSPCKMNCI